MLRERPIFIVGTERSGSNLLRLILNAHPAIAVPHPPHVLRYFASLEAGYGDLTDVENLDNLAGDVLRLLDTHIHPWEIPIDRARLVGDADPKDLFGIFAGLYDQYADVSRKPRWGCKSTFMLHHVDRIFARYPEAKLLLLVRDPRDVAASSKVSVFNPFLPIRTARLWARQQRLGISLSESLGETRLLLQTYEDLISEPERSVTKICSFLDTDFDEGMLRFFETSEARRGGALSESWSNTSRPILSNNSGKYTSGLTPAEILQVEAVAHEEMSELGYPTEHGAEVLERQELPGEMSLHLREAGRQVAVELRSLRKDRNVHLRWRRTLLMQWLGMRRGSELRKHD